MSQSEIYCGTNKMSSRQLSTHAYHVDGKPGVSAAPMVQSSSGTPSGCVRGQPTYISKYECEHNKPSGMLCNPRYINGAWDRFHPYSRDTAQCGGPLPPRLAPQLLNDASLIQASGWEALSDMTLGLMQGGHVGSFSFSEDGRAKVINFDQSHLVNELDMPLMYVYSTPYETGVMRLSLNLTSGRAKLTFPSGNGPAIVEYSIATSG